MDAQLADAFEAFSRNERWGTCASCPRVGGKAFPELCTYTDRYDHQLTLDNLVGAYHRRQRRAADPHTGGEGVAR